LARFIIYRFFISVKYFSYLLLPIYSEKQNDDLLLKKTIAYGSGTLREPRVSQRTPCAGIQALPESFLAGTNDHRNCARKLKLAAFANLKPLFFIGQHGSTHDFGFSAFIRVLQP
jgi:hypothetical protein